MPDELSEMPLSVIGSELHQLVFMAPAIGLNGITSSGRTVTQDADDLYRELRRRDDAGRAGRAVELTREQVHEFSVNLDHAVQQGDWAYVGDLLEPLGIALVRHSGNAGEG